MKKKLETGTVSEKPKPTLEPEKPAKQPKSWAEIEKLKLAASVHVDVGGGGTGVLLKGGLLLIVKHVSKGRASIRFKANCVIGCGF